MSEKRSALDLGSQDFVLSHMTLNRHHPFEDRLAAASGAGFAGIGLLIENYRWLLGNGYSDMRIAELLDEHDLVLSDIEVVRAWAQGGPTGDEEELAWRLADTFGCRYVQAIGPYMGSLSDAVSAFGLLCDRAADHGLVVGLEFLPFTNIRSAADAMTFIEGADRPNGGMCLDIWHHERGARDWGVLEAIPADRIFAVQMNDGARQQIDPDYKNDCLSHRLPVGEGSFEVDRFMALLDHKGVDLPWSLEICNQSSGEVPALPHAQRCADSMRAALSRQR